MMQTGAAAKVSISHLGGSTAQRLEALSDSIMDVWDDIKDVFFDPLTTARDFLAVVIQGLSNN